MKGNKEYMLRALELAARARGRTSPNPMVGAVLVKDGGIVGEGFHRHAGEDHAEVRAIRAAGRDVGGADLYVNLEPCSHSGKTPPCTRAIREAGVKRVFAAIEDPNPLVSGKGGNQLRESGIEVEYGLAAEESRKLNESYLKYMHTGLPFVVLKSAMSLDGKTATRTGDSRWITDGKARAKVHEMRDSVDAILVGIGTVLADDPRLTTRLKEEGGRDPDRIVIDPLLRIPQRAKILESTTDARVIIVTTDNAPEERIKRLRDHGVEIMVMDGKDHIIDMRQIMKNFGQRGIMSVMIEGGAEVAASALSAGIVDKVLYFYAPKIIGGRQAPPAVGGEGIGALHDAILLKNMSFSAVGEGIMVEGYLRNGNE